MSNAGGFKSLTRYYDMLAGNTVWNPWEPQGAYDALATVNLASATASVTFAGIPTGYKHLQIRGIAKSSSSATQMDMTFNSSATNYAYHSLYGNGSSAGSEGSGSMTKIPVGVMAASSATSIFTSFVIDILDYAQANKNKTVRTLLGFDTNGAGTMYFNSGAWFDTTAVSGITLTNRDYTFPQYSSFALFGVK